MKLGVNVPNFGAYADPRVFASLAVDTEQAGWDGLFVWDHMLVWSGNMVGDPWVLLAAAAAATNRIALGPMVTPVPRRRPWKLAREAVTLDQLSDGRLIFGAGIGYPPDPEFTAFGEPVDERTRGEMLDEGLEILSGLWTGQPFQYSGRHYRLEEMTFLPAPVQLPRIPIWIAGMWPNRRPFRRAARFEGVFPIKSSDEMPMLEPAELAEIVRYVDQYRESEGPYEVVTYADLRGEAGRAAELIEQWSEAGATWIHIGPGDFGMEPVETFRARIRTGPPGL
ncbi:MAG: LLM class flavin-dependent oxidoreductase [Acidimicrobiia bacterium]|nr:LLM class flavin-dependent oxidoreductase [Acidimicrobiia bacterium]